MTAPTTQRAGLDSRVTDEDGQPAAERRFIRWFRVRRAEGSAGVILAVRIPGYLAEDQAHRDQDAALRAARRIYTDYREAVRVLSDQSEQEDPS
jgi:hypothetical protein